MAKTVELPPPAHWQDFEELCRDLWQRLWEDPNAQMHGRRGQPQHGVDVFGRPQEGGEWAGVQCKLKSQLSGERLGRAEIEAEVEKARGFNPRLASFTIATTAPRDAEAQRVAREITEAQLAEGWFAVTIASWEEVTQDLGRYPDLLERYYSQFMVREIGAGRGEREAYLRAMWSRWMPLPLMGVGSHREDVPLCAVYTALDVTAELIFMSHVANEGREREAFHTPGLGGEAWYLERLEARIEAEAQGVKASGGTRGGTEEVYSRRASAVEAAAAAPRLVLLGPAGSGKSSFARHLALCLAGELLGRSEANLERLNGDSEEGPAQDAEMAPWPHKAPLPVLIELRKLVRGEEFRSSAEADAQSLVRYATAVSPELSELAPAALAEPGGVLLILDGLDETPGAVASRDRLREWIGSFVRGYPECRVLVTSRPYAYRPGSRWRLDGLGFEEVTLAPLDPAQSRAFISAWYAVLAERGQVDREQAQRRADHLVKEIQATRYLRPLAELPLMLTMMTDLHASGGGRLRGGRAGLYERSVELLLDRWNEVRDVMAGGTVAEQLGMGVDEIRRAVERLAYDVHRERGQAKGEAVEISDTELWQALDRERSSERVVDERRVMDYLHQRSGILLAESPSVYRFPHRSYQEYLAACHLVGTDFPEQLGEEVEHDPSLWREVVQLAVGKVAGTPFTAWSLLETLVPESPAGKVEQDDPRFERALFAALAVRECELWRRVGRKEHGKLERIRCWLERSLEVGALSPVDRAAGGRVLGLLGDRRPGVGLREDGIPDIDWMEVPAGKFIMGSSEEDPSALDRERPQHEVELPAFQISRMPVTNAQYTAFVEDGGYTKSRRPCWSEEGWEWKGEREGPDDEIQAELLLPNHPRVNVSWYEADAFCQWLSEKVRQEVRLPLEEEWEKAARGADGRLYPWGEKFDASLCNSMETRIGQPSAVGMFPDGASPFGVLDLSGNVWEWMLSPWTEDHSGRGGTVDPGAEVAKIAESPGGAARVYRGGSYANDARRARSAYRDRVEPQGLFWDQGFRVLLPPPQPEDRS